jgi:hypothetical protein
MMMLEALQQLSRPTIGEIAFLLRHCFIRWLRARSRLPAFRRSAEIGEPASPMILDGTVAWPKERGPPLMPSPDRQDGAPSWPASTHQH